MMDALEFKELAGLVLRLRGVSVAMSACHPLLRYNDALVSIEGIYNLKQLQVNVRMPKVGAVSTGFTIYESVGKKIKRYQPDKDVIKHLLSITALDQLARL